MYFLVFIDQDRHMTVSFSPAKSPDINEGGPAQQHRPVLLWDLLDDMYFSAVVLERVRKSCDAT